MLGTAKSVIGIQGRLNVGGAGIVRCTSYRRALKRSLHHGALRKPPTALLCPVSSSNNHQRQARAPLSTSGQVGKVVTGRKLPDTGDIVHDRFLLRVEKGDASGAMAHFAFIACEGGPLMTLRRRQLLVLLCEKGMVKEASELLTSATASPTFNSQDLSTIASFLYVMCGCLRHGDVDRALEHFRQASERGISLDLPLCESLATALFIKGLQGGSTEMAAWNVLDYIRQRGMEHRPEVFDHALIYATACGDLSFALRICQYVDEEGVCCDSDVRDALCRSVAMATKKLPDTAAVTSNGGEREDWKVEGTNATVEELWALDSLLQSWLDTEIEEIGEDFIDDDRDEDSDEDEEFETDVLDADEDRVVYDADRFADIVDYDGSNVSVKGDDNAHGNGEDTSGGREQGTEEASTTTDFGGDEFCGDLVDQMSKLYPNQENMSFRAEDELGTLPPGLRRPGGMQAGGGDKSRRSVYADLVMPYGDPHGEGEQGIMSIPVKISVEEKNDDDDDDDDDDDADDDSGAV